MHRHKERTCTHIDSRHIAIKYPPPIRTHTLIMKLGYVVVFCACAALLSLGSLFYYSVYDYQKHMSMVQRTYSTYDPLTDCAAPFGQLLGVADDVPAYSNCNTKFTSTYINYVNLMDPMDNGRRGDPSEMRVIMTAYRYSAFDYYMRWLVWNRGIMPRLVENTNQLWKRVDYFNPAKPEQDWSAEYITNYEEVTSLEERKFNAPRRADAVIYRMDEKTLPAGHIAVVVKVEDDIEAAGGLEKLKDLKKMRLHPRRVYVAEQNCQNQPWGEHNYSRVLQFKWRAVSEMAHEGYYVDPDGLDIIGCMRVGKSMPLRAVPDPYQETLDMENDGDL
ncbi:hypothetical protein, conserved [Leishmania braziliensis MHOM/BR/75/M2904]|uniref:Peptidase C51 domain-containing protein n=2 Tax=Leishmania braziliensis TaxID=5660 RepID=A4HEJ1_LEIBR|nr:hypothetical protein, conserved [Leishmania braziliensis MHOM/BR/75/M2904]KAI5690355.1 hypothetical protein MNV84_04519 [Leishmania braziliensis]CAJ2474324.1 unnamed protein product [Leishmania braziliensis]CAM39247.1 hypothetical protein, conserved [Leishmania braziliensis MHOM/BR/75/M2904]